MNTWVVLLCATVCVSFSGVFVRLARVNGFISAFYRILFAFFVVMPAFITKRRRYDPIDIITCIIGGSIFGYELALWNISVVLLNATVPTLLVNLSCIWIGLFSFFALKEKLTTTHWIGAAIALFGVMMIIGLSSIIHMKIEKGVILAITCSIMISIYTLIVKKARYRMDAVSVLFYTLLGSMLALIVWAVVGKISVFPQSRGSWLYLVGLGVVVQGFGYLGINYALGYISSAKVTLALLLQPVFTGILAVFLIQERITSSQMCGSVLVLIGLSLSLLQIKGRKSKSS